MSNFGHGGNVKEIARVNKLNYKDIVDFSANINPLGMSKYAKDSIVNNIESIENYPDITYFELKKSIVDFENSSIFNDREHISVDNLVVGNGAAEILFNLVRAIKPKNTLLLAPTFSEYEEAIDLINGNKKLYILREEFDFKIQENILDEIDKNIDLIFICNPNNPTGQITEKSLLKKMLDKAKEKDVFLVMDESFLDFTKDSNSMINYLKTYDNLLIVRSLTKFFALPGLRMGYLMSSNNILNQKIIKETSAWNINIMAEIATRASLKDKEYINNTLKFVNKEKHFLLDELTKFEEIKIFEPSANFIFIKVLKGIDLKLELLKHGILIRKCDNYNALNNEYYRIAVRTRKENIRLIDTLRLLIN